MYTCNSCKYSERLVIKGTLWDNVRICRYNSNDYVLDYASNLELVNAEHCCDEYESNR